MSESDPICDVFEAWRVRQPSPGRVTLTEERRKTIGARLRRGFDADDLVLLVQYAYEADTDEARFWRADNAPPGTRQYLGLDNLLRVSKLSDRIDRAHAWADVELGEDDPEDGVILSGVGLLRRSG